LICYLNPVFFLSPGALRSPASSGHRCTSQSKKEFHIVDNYDHRLAQLLEQRANSGSRWFYWIAALSVLTSAIAFSGTDWRFLVSLGLTQVVDGIAKGMSGQFGNSIKIIALMFDLLATGLFVFLGFMAGKKQLWAFITGLALFVLDGLIFLIAGDIFGLIFHAYVIYSIYGGLSACRRLNRLQKDYQHPPAPVLPDPAAATDVAV
jgi:hypothetical protein